MAKTRSELSQRLHKICEHCYFSPPSSGMVYPCIVYELSQKDPKYADNLKYLMFDRYSLMLIDENPDSEYVEDILELDYCQMDRPPYTKDGLNHFVFTLYW